MKVQEFSGLIRDPGEDGSSKEKNTSGKPIPQGHSVWTEEAGLQGRSGRAGNGMELPGSSGLIVSYLEAELGLFQARPCPSTSGPVHPLEGRMPFWPLNDLQPIETSATCHV